MSIGPREAAHREYQEALKARTAAAEQYGLNSEAYKAAAARLAAAIKNLPEPPPKWD